MGLRHRERLAADRRIELMESCVNDGSLHRLVRPFQRRLLLYDVRRDRKRKRQNNLDRVRDEALHLHYRVKRRSIESSYSLPRRRSKGNMETLTWHDDSRGTSPDGKFIIGARYAVANGRFLIAIGGFMSPSADIAERSQRCIIKAGRRSRSTTAKER